MQHFPFKNHIIRFDMLLHAFFNTLFFCLNWNLVVVNIFRLFVIVYIPNLQFGIVSQILKNNGIRTHIPAFSEPICHYMRNKKRQVMLWRTIYFCKSYKFKPRVSVLCSSVPLYTAILLLSLSIPFRKKFCQLYGISTRKFG